MSSKRIKGITIEIGGDTTGLDKALSGVNRQINTTQSALKDVNKLLKLDPGNTELLAQKQRLLTEAISQTTDKLNTLKEAQIQARRQLEMGELGIEQFEALSREIIETESVLRDLQSQANSSEQSLNELSDSTRSTQTSFQRIADAARTGGEATANIINKTATVTKTAANTIGTVTKKVVSTVGTAAKTVTSTVGTVTKKVATAIGTAAKTAATGMAVATGAFAAGTATIKELVNSTEELRTDLSHLDSNAREASIGIEKARDAYKTFAIISGEADSSVEAMSNLLQAGFTESNLQKAVEGLTGAYLRFPDTLKIESLADSLQETLATGAATGQFAEVLERLGLNLEEFDNKMSTLTSDTERQNFALETLSKAGLMNTYKQYVKNNEELLASKRATQDYEEALAQLGEKLQPISTKITQTTTHLINNTSQMVDEILNIMSKLQNGELSMADVIERACSKGGEIVKNVSTGMKEKIPIIVDTVNQIMTNLISGVENKLPDFINRGNDLIIGFAGILKDKIILIAEVASEIMISLISGIESKLPFFIQKGMELIVGLVKVVRENMPLIIEVAINIMSKLISGIESKLPEFIDKGLDIIAGLAEKIRKNIGLIVDKGIELVLAIGNGISEALPSLFEKVPGIVIDIARIINENFPKIIEAGLKLMASLAKGIWDSLPTVLANLPKIIEAIFQTFMAFNWWNLGKNIMNGIANGIKTMGGELKTAATDGLSGVLEYIKSLPTKAVTWGKDMILGFVNGIKSKISSIKDAVKNVAETITSFLHFSRPDVGPLHEYEKWMPDFIGRMAQQIGQKKYLITDAVKQMATDMKNEMGTKIVTAGNTNNNTAINFNGSYQFGNQGDINYFMNQAALKLAVKR